MFNAFNDQDGCPDVLPVGLMHISGLVSSIHFTHGSAQLDERSIETLYQIKAALQMYDRLSLSIEGHTDDVGAAHHNIQLSQARADAVLMWLVEHGISQARIQATGYGAKMPLVSNRSKAGRDLNRRVELIYVEASSQR